MSNRQFDRSQFIGFYTTAQTKEKVKQVAALAGCSVTVLMDALAAHADTLIETLPADWHKPQ